EFAIRAGKRDRKEILGKPFTEFVHSLNRDRNDVDLGGELETLGGQEGNQGKFGQNAGFAQNAIGVSAYPPGRKKRYRRADSNVSGTRVKRGLPWCNQFSRMMNGRALSITAVAPSSTSSS
ncbi:MAG: hypothetical protein VB959_20725, partial [Rhodospirillales bacterium]